MCDGRKEILMGKAQFLELLSQKLSEELSHSEVINQLNYYESYINAEIVKGRLEEDVMEELGDPYMIARTIIDMHTGDAFEDVVYEESVNTDPAEHQSYKNNRKTIMMGSWGCLLTAIILVLVGIVVIAVVTGLIAVLMPVLVPVLIVVLVLFFIKGNQR